MCTTTINHYMNQLIMQYKLCSQDRNDPVIPRVTPKEYTMHLAQMRHLTMLLSFQAVRLLLLVVRTCTDHVVADFKVCRFTIKLPDYLKLAISICLRRSFPYAGKILFWITGRAFCFFHTFPIIANLKYRSYHFMNIRYQMHPHNLRIGKLLN